MSLSKDEELELRELQARQTEKHERRVTDVARALCFVARINDKYGSGVEPLARVLVDIAEGWRQ